MRTAVGAADHEDSPRIRQIRELPGVGVQIRRNRTAGRFSGGLSRRRSHPCVNDARRFLRGERGTTLPYRVQTGQDDSGTT